MTNVSGKGLQKIGGKEFGITDAQKKLLSETLTGKGFGKIFINLGQSIAKKFERIRTVFKTGDWINNKAVMNKLTLQCSELREALLSNKLGDHVLDDNDKVNIHKAVQNMQEAIQKLKETGAGKNALKTVERAIKTLDQYAAAAVGGVERRAEGQKAHQEKNQKRQGNLTQHPSDNRSTEVENKLEENAKKGGVDETPIKEGAGKDLKPVNKRILKAEPLKPKVKEGKINKIAGRADIMNASLKEEEWRDAKKKESQEVQAAGNPPIQQKDTVALVLKVTEGSESQAQVALGKKLKDLVASINQDESIKNNIQPEEWDELEDLLKTDFGKMSKQEVYETGMSILHHISNANQFNKSKTKKNVTIFTKEDAKVGKAIRASLNKIAEELGLDKEDRKDTEKKHDLEQPKVEETSTTKVPTKGETGKKGGGSSTLVKIAQVASAAMVAGFGIYMAMQTHAPFKLDLGLGQNLSDTSSPEDIGAQISANYDFRNMSQETVKAGLHESIGKNIKNPVERQAFINGVVEGMGDTFTDLPTGDKLVDLTNSVADLSSWLQGAGKAVGSILQEQTEDIINYFQSGREACNLPPEVQFVLDSYYEDLYFIGATEAIIEKLKGIDMFEGVPVEDLLDLAFAVTSELKGDSWWEAYIPTFDCPRDVNGKLPSNCKTNFTHDQIDKARTAAYNAIRGTHGKACPAAKAAADVAVSLTRPQTRADAMKADIYKFGDFVAGNAVPFVTSTAFVAATQLSELTADGLTKALETFESAVEATIEAVKFTGNAVATIAADSSAAVTNAYTATQAYLNLNPVPEQVKIPTIYLNQSTDTGNYFFEVCTFDKKLDESNIPQIEPPLGFPQLSLTEAQTVQYVVRDIASAKIAANMKMPADNPVGSNTKMYAAHEAGLRQAIANSVCNPIESATAEQINYGLPNFSPYKDKLSYIEKLVNQASEQVNKALSDAAIQLANNGLNEYKLALGAGVYFNTKISPPAQKA